MRNANTVSQSDVFSQLRLPLVVLVTYAHSYSFVAPGYSLMASGWDAYEVVKLLFSQSLVKVVVPVFFIMSGYLFFRNLQSWDTTGYLQKLRRRAVSLLLPYVVWNLLMALKLGTFRIQVFWAFWAEAGRQTDWLGHINLLTAPCNMPLWFLRDLMVMTLLAPLLHVVLRRWGRWVVPLLALLFLSGVGAFAVPGLSVCSLFFFSLGAWVSLCGRSLTVEALRLEPYAYVLSALLLAAMLITYGSVPFSSLMLMFRLTGAVAVFCLAYRGLAATRWRMPHTVCRASYFLYLGHYVFFLSFLDGWLFRLPLPGGEAAVNVFHFLVAPLLKAALFVAAYVAYRWLMQRAAHCVAAHADTADSRRSHSRKPSIRK